MFVAIQLIVQTYTKLLRWWLNLALTLKVQLVMLWRKKLILYNLLCVLVCFTFLTTSELGGGLSHLKSHNFVIRQDNETIFGTFMSVW